jgi:hypothetical protein
MKKVLLALAVMLGLGVAATPASAALFVAGTDNDAFFNNFENLYDSSGNWRDPSSTPAVGDHLVGIINVQNIDSFGASHWTTLGGLFTPTTSELSGVFAQRIDSIVVDPLDPTHLTLVFSNPTLTGFCKGADCFSTGLAAGEMFSLYLDQPANTLFQSNGTLLDDVTRAKDDAPVLLTFGLSAPTDVAGSDVDLVGIGGLPQGRAFGALSVIQNNTGFTFDPFVREGLFGQMIFTSEFEINPNGLAAGGTSPWEFRSNDPAALHPTGIIPEPSSLILLGLGGLGAGLARRKKLVA